MSRNIVFSLLLVLVLLAGVGAGCDVIDNIPTEIPDLTGTPTAEPTAEPSSGGNIPVNFDNWLKINTGSWEETAGGIRVYGAGYRYSHQGMYSRDYFDFRNTETYVKWRAHGGPGGEYSAFWAILASDYNPQDFTNSGGTSTGLLTTHHSWSSSVVISEDTWYYTRIQVGADGAYTTVTAAGNYDDSGGSVIRTQTGTYENSDNGQILIIFNDNYGGTGTYVEVSEVSVNAGAAATPTATATPTVTTPTPTSSNEKTITIWCCPGVRNATLNGGIPLVAGQENSAIIMLNHPLWAEFDYTDTYGREQHTRVDLDSYYDFFILRENGGWSQDKYRNAYEEGKLTCPPATETPVPTSTPTPTTGTGSTTSLGRFPSALAWDGSNVWVTTKGDGKLNKLNGSTGALIASYDVGEGPDDVIFDGTYLWVANQYGDTVMKVNPGNGSVVGTYAVGDYPTALAYDGQNIWVANRKGYSITKLRASDGETLLTYALPGSGKMPDELAFDGTNLWVGCYWGYLMRFNVSSDTLQPSYSTGGHVTGLASDGESVRALIWHEGGDNPEVRKYSIGQWLWLGDYELKNVELPSAITYDGSSFWVTDNTGNTVTRLPAGYPSNAVPGATSMTGDEVVYQTGDGPAALLYANGYIWVANDRDATITRIAVR